MSFILCPYCSSKAFLQDSARVYNGRSFGPAYICANYPQCDAYVGCHPGTIKPLGRLANGELRRWKQKAHVVFDHLWKAKMAVHNVTKYTARNAAYSWLAEEMGIPKDECHIGMFDVEQCRRVVEICEPHMRAA